jgi:sarcosine oxidase subunit gamma
MTVLGSGSALHSATDVSHRNTAIIVSGPGAEATLSAGCPQDLSLEIFPVGACSRTLFGKVEVVLLRVAEDTFRVEVWRSFSDYAFGLLAEAASDTAF